MGSATTSVRAGEESYNHGGHAMMATARDSELLRRTWRTRTAVTTPAMRSTGEGRCCGLLRSTAFLLRATTACIGGERPRRGKRGRFGERGLSVAEDERGAGLFHLCFLLRFLLL